MLLLRRAIRKRPLDDLRSEADRLYGEIAAAYLAGRGGAALAGGERARAELDVLAPGAGGVALLRRTDVLEEARRTNRAARGYVQRWLDKALGLEPEAGAAAGPKAHRVLAPALEAGAATEATEAFNAERVRVIEQAVARRPELAQALEQVWDAELDKRTCPTCEGLDGTTAPLGERFPDGDPPLHPRCRCTIAIQPRGY